jgi:hypothetical protein
VANFGRFEQRFGQSLDLKPPEWCLYRLSRALKHMIQVFSAETPFEVETGTQVISLVPVLRCTDCVFPTGKSFLRNRSGEADSGFPFEPALGLGITIKIAIKTDGELAVLKVANASVLLIRHDRNILERTSQIDRRHGIASLMIGGSVKLAGCALAGHRLNSIESENTAGLDPLPGMDYRARTGPRLRTRRREENNCHKLLCRNTRTWHKFATYYSV